MGTDCFCAENDAFAFIDCFTFQKYNDKNEDPLHISLFTVKMNSFDKSQIYSEKRKLKTKG